MRRIHLGNTSCSQPEKNKSDAYQFSNSFQTLQTLQIVIKRIFHLAMSVSILYISLSQCLSHSLADITVGISIFPCQLYINVQVGAVVTVAYACS